MDSIPLDELTFSVVPCNFRRQAPAPMTTQPTKPHTWMDSAQVEFAGVAVSEQQTPIRLNQKAPPATRGFPIPKRKYLRWDGPKLSDIARSHREEGTEGTPPTTPIPEEIFALKGVPLFSLNLPWDQLLYGQWKTTRRRWAFIGLIHLILTRHLGQKLRPGGYARMHFDEVARFLGNRLGPEVLEAAKVIGIIECDGAAKEFVRSNGYRFTALALSYGPAVSRASLHLAKKLATVRRYRPDIGDNPVHRQMWKTLHKVRLNSGILPALKARLQGEGLVSALCSIYSVDAVRRGLWRYSTDKNTGRVFHNVANFPSELRPYLTIRGGLTGEADIASSQPYFLAALAYRGDTSEEANAFRALVASENFYETFGGWIGLAGKDRKKLKKQFYAEVLFGLKKYRGKMWAAMAARFPRLATYVDRIKEDNYRELARILQHEEARVVIGIIVPALTAQGIEGLSIHDGLMVRQEHLPEVQRVMKAELERVTGIRPLIRIKTGQ